MQPFIVGSVGNRMITLSVQSGGTPIEMTPVKATILSLFMLSGILMWGAGIYSADAAGGHVVDGYGVTVANR